MGPALLPPPRCSPVGSNSLGSNSLIRQLKRLGIAPGAPARATVAEDLGQWLAWTDAIALSAALQPAPAARPMGKAAVEAEAAIEDDVVVGADRPANSAALAASQALSELRRRLADALLANMQGADRPAVDGDHSFAPWRSLYARQQRLMAEPIAALRAQLRTVLTRRSAAQAPLAALDAVLEQALAARERHLLAGLPGWLEKSKRASQVAPATPWPDDIQTHLQDLLLAELDLRLQPLEGLVQALQPEGSTRRT